LEAANCAVKKESRDGWMRPSFLECAKRCLEEPCKIIQKTSGDRLQDKEQEWLETLSQSLSLFQLFLWALYTSMSIVAVVTNAVPHWNDTPKNPETWSLTGVTSERYTNRRGVIRLK
jgi:hypothetical protein